MGFSSKREEPVAAPANLGILVLSAVGQALRLAVLAFDDFCCSAGEKSSSAHSLLKIRIQCQSTAPNNMLRMTQHPSPLSTVGDWHDCE
jgi:hypothetical protein